MLSITAASHQASKPAKTCKQGNDWDKYSIKLFKILIKISAGSVSRTDSAEEPAIKNHSPVKIWQNFFDWMF